MKTRLAICILFVMCLVKISTAHAEPKMALEALLSGIEYVPTTEELLQGRTRAELERELVALTGDLSKPTFVRTRATALLGRFQSEVTRARLEAMLDDGTDHPSVLLAALRTSASFGPALSLRLERYASHADVHLAEAARVSLAKAR